MARTRSTGSAPHDDRNRRQRKLIDDNMLHLGIDTIVGLEDKAGVKRDRVRHFLKGYTKSLSSDDTHKICATLGIAVHDFVGRSATDKAASHFVYKLAEVTSVPPKTKPLGHIGIELPASSGMPAKNDNGCWIVAGDMALSPAIARGDLIWIEWAQSFSASGVYLLKSTAKNAPILLRRVSPHGLAGKIDVVAENGNQSSESNISQSAVKFLGRATHILKKI